VKHIPLQHLIWLVGLALLLASLNALKPLHIDDANIYGNARQAAYHPLDPYGYTVFWLQWPEPDAWMLVPPGVPYWWAPAIRLFGESPVAWKLWFAPVLWLMLLSLYRIASRLAPGMEMSLVWLLAFSPAVLPGINLMLDVPAIAFALTGLALGMSAVDRGSLPRALLAGLVAGIGIETKYSVALMPAVIFLYALLHRRIWIGLVSGLAATAVFVGWESWIAHLYGMSQFVFSLRWSEGVVPPQPKSMLLHSLVNLVGALAPTVALLVMATMSVSWLYVAGLTVLVVAGFVALLMAPIADPLFAVMGLATWCIELLALKRLLSPLRDSGGAEINSGDEWRRQRRLDWFLLGWFILELIACVVISPFAATRRVLGLIVVMMIVAARLASRVRLPARRPILVRSLLIVGATLGLGLFAIDTLDARAQRQAVEVAADRIERQRQPGQQVWFVGHWDVQYYAMHHGYQPVVPDHSILRQGDWLIDSGQSAPQSIALPGADELEELDPVIIDDAIAVAAVPFYYGWHVPLDHRDWPRAVIRLFRVRHDFTPVTSIPPTSLVRWAATRGRPLPPDSVPAIIRATTQVSDAAAVAAAMTRIADSGPTALQAALSADRPDVRQWAIERLAALGPAARQALPALHRAAADDADSTVRDAAVAAIRRIDSGQTH
jgi:hypothetical protein